MEEIMRNAQPQTQKTVVVSFQTLQYMEIIFILPRSKTHQKPGNMNKDEEKFLSVKGLQ